MPFIGTFGDTDPYWRHRQLDQVNQWMTQLAGAFAQRRENKQREMDDDIGTFFQRAAQYPELIDTMGPELVERYGEENPWLAGAMDALGKRRELPDQMAAAGEKWLSAADAEAERGQGIEQMLAQLGPALGAPGIPMPKLDPGMVAGPMREQALAKAAEGLSPRERALAQAWSRERGMPFPDQTPLSLQDLPLAARGAHLAATQELPPETEQAARIAAKLELTPWQEDFKTMKEVEGRRSEQRIGLEEKRLKLNQARLDLDEKREARLAAGKAGTAAAEKPYTPARLGSMIHSDSKSRAAEAAPPKKLGRGEKLVDVEGGKYLRDATGKLSPIPQEMSTFQANRLARKVASSTADPALQLQASEGALQKFFALQDQGLTSDEAFRHVMDGTMPGAGVGLHNVAGAGAGD